MFARLLKLGGFFPNTTRYPDQKLEEEAATAYAGYVANRTNSQTDTALVKRVTAIPALIKCLLIGIFRLPGPPVRSFGIEQTSMPLWHSGYITFTRSYPLVPA